MNRLVRASVDSRRGRGLIILPTHFLVREAAREICKLPGLQGDAASPTYFNAVVAPDALVPVLNLRQMRDLRGANCVAFWVYYDCLSPKHPRSVTWGLREWCNRNADKQIHEEAG